MRYHLNDGRGRKKDLCEKRQPRGKSQSQQEDSEFLQEHDMCLKGRGRSVVKT